MKSTLNAATAAHVCPHVNALAPSNVTAPADATEPASAPAPAHAPAHAHEPVPAPAPAHEPVHEPVQFRAASRYARLAVPSMIGSLVE